MGVNIIISSEISNEYFKVIDLEDAAVADFATFAGGKTLHEPLSQAGFLCL